MNEGYSKIISGIPYKIKKEKNVDLIYEYLLKQSKRTKVMSIVLISIWILYIIFYFISRDIGINALSKFDSIVSLLQILILPSISFILFRMSKKNMLTKEEIKQVFKNQSKY